MALIAIEVLVGLGLAVELMCCIGIFAMKTPLQRLHYIGPATTLGPALFAIAVIAAKHTLTGAGWKAAIVAVIVIAAGPVLSHKTAQAAWSRK